MTQTELAEKRVELWRLRPDLAPNDEKEIRKFIKEAGFCYTYHMPKDTIPSLIQTVSGSVNAPGRYKNSVDDPFYEMINETFQSYYKQKLFIEVVVFGKHPVIVYRDVFTRLYRLSGADVQRGYLSRRKRNTNLEKNIISFLNENGSTTRRELRLSLLDKRKNNATRLTKALDSLGRQLKIIRTRQKNNELRWITPETWNPHLCNKAIKIERDEAIEYLALRFLQISVASSRKALRRFFKNVIPPAVMDHTLNSLIQRGIIVIDPDLIRDGKRALKVR